MEEQRKEKNSSKKVTELETKHTRYKIPGALNTVAGEGVLQEDRFVFLRKQVTHLFSPREKTIYGYAIYSTECQLLCHLFFLLPC